MSYGKAITSDGITDSIFKKENPTRVAEIFKDLWSTDLLQIEGIEASFTSRIEVNLLRAICVIKISTEEKKKQCKYGLFIDFANAYNTVPHSLLFRKLRQKKCLDEEEIDFIEALYSRYRIRIGKSSTIKEQRRQAS